jgi:hypothetical protein
VLLSHLILCEFIYPSDPSPAPAGVRRELAGRLQRDRNGDPVPERLCQGTLLSLLEYRIDLDRWGYQDARVRPWGNMTQEDVDFWSAAFEK